MHFVSVFVLLSLTTVDSHDWSRLSTPPRPQPGFDVNRYLGLWYVQAMTWIDTWRGAWDFTDFVTRYERRGADRLALLFSWRKTECAKASHQYIPDGPIPGVFFLGDNFGDMLTGRSIVVATDYNSFTIKWGCALPCDAPYVVVKTRRRRPDSRTWEAVKEILFVNWKLSLSHMRLYTHSKLCIDDVTSRGVCKPDKWWKPKMRN